MKSIPLKDRPGLAAFLIIAITTLVRIWFTASGQLDLVQDEAQYWDWSRTLQLSYYSKGPFIAWLNWAGTAMFGNIEFGVRFFAVFLNLCTQVVLYLALARLMKRPGLALATLVAANTAPLFMASGLLMTTDTPLVFFWVLALVCLYQAGRKGGWWVWPVLALSMCLGVLAKYMMLAFVPVALVYVLGLAREGLADRRMVLGLAAALLIGTLAGLAPILAWNMENDFVAFRHVAALAGVSESAGFIRLDTLPEHVAAQLGVITPWWLALMLMAGWRCLRRAFARKAGQYVPEAGAEEKRLRWLLIAGFWPGWLGFLLWSLHTQIYPNWPAVCYAAGFVLAGMELERVFKSGGLWARRLVKYSLAASAVLFVAAHAIGVIPLPGKIDPAIRLKGWSDLGRHCETLRATEFSDPDKVFFFSDEYDITAALAFYIPGRPRTFCALIDRRLNQYDLWPGPQDKMGWDAVFVVKDFKQGDVHPTLAAMFESVEAKHYQSRHRGAPAMKFTLVLCRGFTGFWPDMHGGEDAQGVEHY